MRLEGLHRQNNAETDIPDKKLTNENNTHHLQALLKLAGLDKEFREAIASNGELFEDWRTVKDWTEERRYQLLDPPFEPKGVYRRAAQSRVRLFLNAVEGSVLPWIRQRW